MQDGSFLPKDRLHKTSYTLQWFWTDNNKTFVQIRYGTRVLELQKGKNTIETASADDLIKTLGIVRTCVANGELDSVIEAASVKVRERFGK